jgi:hypothetical protein
LGVLDGELDVSGAVAGEREASIWRTFGQRRSLLTNGPRNATNPAGALLNLTYGLIEAETTLALHAVGLDPGIGIFHTDRRDRDSLTLDVMEAIRPVGDAYVLGLLTQRTLSARDFIETPKPGSTDVVRGRGEGCGCGGCWAVMGVVPVDLAWLGVIGVSFGVSGPGWRRRGVSRCARGDWCVRGSGFRRRGARGFVRALG